VKFKMSLFMGVFMVLGLCRAASVAEEKKIQVLIVDGFSNHDWQHTTRCIQGILSRSDRFVISISTFPASGSAQEVEAWNPQFSDYDVIIQTCNDLGGSLKWPSRVEQALEIFVKQGGGLYIFHSANNAFSDWDEYNLMIGLGWRNKDFGWAITLDQEGKIIRIPAGEGENTGHGKRENTVLTRLGDHPLHVGFPRQWVAADIEVYRFARGPAENLSVLSYAKDRKTGINFPIEWTISYGEGRVYNSTLGHVWENQKEPEGICCAGFQTLVPRVVQWLSGGPVDPEVPEDLPTAESASMRAYPSDGIF
jgi:type 1 glutamine amidotransferase